MNSPFPLVCPVVFFYWFVEASVHVKSVLYPTNTFSKLLVGYQQGLGLVRVRVRVGVRVKVRVEVRFKVGVEVGVRVENGVKIRIRI